MLFPANSKRLPSTLPSQAHSPASPWTNSLFPWVMLVHANRSVTQSNLPALRQRTRVKNSSLSCYWILKSLIKACYCTPYPRVGVSAPTPWRFRPIRFCFSVVILPRVLVVYFLGEEGFFCILRLCWFRLVPVLIFIRKDFVSRVNFVSQSVEISPAGNSRERPSCNCFVVIIFSFYFCPWHYAKVSLPFSLWSI